MITQPAKPAVFPLLISAILIAWLPIVVINFVVILFIFLFRLPILVPCPITDSFVMFQSLPTVHQSTPFIHQRPSIHQFAPIPLLFYFHHPFLDLCTLPLNWLPWLQVP